MSTDTDLANQALGLIGQDSVPSLLTSLNNKTVVAINQQLASVKEAALRARDWNCARRRAQVVAVTNESLGEWAYAYRAPSDCLAIRRLIITWPVSVSTSLWGYTAISQRHAYSWEVGADGKRILYCDLQNAGIVYTANITDVNRWDRLLFNACAAMLASRLASSFAKDVKMANAFLMNAFQEFDEGVGVDEAEGDREIEVSTEFINVR